MENPHLLPYKILIGTHHKTGTAWLESIFTAICRQFSLSISLCSRKVLPDPACDIVFNYHSAFDPGSLSTDYRGTHLIRDPRDVIISGCFYHQKSQEKWLYEPLERLHGKTYHDKINSLQTLDEQLLFEMEYIGQITIRDMLNWNYANPLFHELRYESLIRDTELILFRELFTFLGMAESWMPELLQIASKHSLFSAQNLNTGHVRSGDTDQWKKYFKPIHKQRFLELFDDGLIRLGYEKDNKWAIE